MHGGGESQEMNDMHEQNDADVNSTASPSNNPWRHQLSAFVRWSAIGFFAGAILHVVVVFAGNILMYGIHHTSLELRFVLQFGAIPGLLVCGFISSIRTGLLVRAISLASKGTADVYNWWSDSGLRKGVSKLISLAIRADPKQPLSILAVNSCGCGIAACVCAAIFFVFPKHGIAVVPGLALMGSVGISGIGTLFGLLALATRSGRSRFI